MRKRMLEAVLVVIVVSLGFLFVACGGGSGTGGGGSQTGSVSLYFTDTPADVYSSVLVKVYEVNLCSDYQCQNKVNLFTNQQGLEVDLSKLKGILQYINTSNIPQATYNRLEVVMDKNLTIVDGSGNSHAAIFTPMQEKPNKPNTVQCDSRCYIRFNGTVQPFSTGKLIVDFKLKDFDVNQSATPWQVTEVKMMPLTPQDSMPTYYKVYLTVQSVNSQNNTITGTWMGKTYTVNITQGTVCEINGVYYSGTNCTAQINSNMCLEIKSNADLTSSSTLTAVKIETENPQKCYMMSSSPPPSQPVMKLKGYVTAKGANTFNLNTYSNPIEITSSTYCEYQKNVYMTGNDCFTNLQTGWLVEVKINSSNQAIKIEREWD